MTNKISSQIDIQILETTDSDVWSDFRQIERITIELTQRYKYSLGKYSRFFIELENQRFMATKCENCSKIFVPPRPLCPNCLEITQWVELSGEGIVKTFSILHFSSGGNDDVNALETPYILAYVLLDGASTLFPHLLKADLDSVKIEMPVKVAYNNHPVHHPIHLMHFVPTE